MGDRVRKGTGLHRCHGCGRREENGRSGEVGRTRGQEGERRQRKVAEEGGRMMEAARKRVRM